MKESIKLRYEKRQITVRQPDTDIVLVTILTALITGIGHLYVTHTNSPKRWLTLEFPIPTKSESVCALTMEG